ncbi:MAG: hypothetical protein ACJA1A_003197 [Saprospiraceae bacterium]|jgi:hypothetical protein|tara:strand:+ start:638 stop:1243 length:606 start_codon:yes stop_codon:yes gene_type:complete
MENALIERVKSQARGLKTLSDELQVQMALGKAEARDLIKKEKKTLTKFINEQKKKIEKSQNITEDNRRIFLTCMEDLEGVLFADVPTQVADYDQYKNDLLSKVYKLEEEVRKNYPSMTIDIQDELDVFKAKMDAFRVNIALHDKDDPEKVEKIRSEFTEKLTDIRSMLSNREKAQSKLDNFVEDISESFNYLKRAIADLSN